VRIGLRPFEYMAWAKSVPRGARFDLTASGMADAAAPGPQGEVPGWEGTLDVARLCRRTSRYEAEASFVRVLSERYGVTPAQVVPTLGASLAITHVLLALLRAGDHVVVERPTYEALHRVPEILGASVSRLERRFEDGWGVVPDRLARLLTPRTKVVLLTNLHNPSGVAIPRDVLHAVTDLVARVGGLVLVDEVYLDYAFDVGPGAGVLPACRVASNAVSWSSTTKCFGFGALRAGWVVAGDPDVAKAVRTATDYLYVDPPVSSLDLGARVVEQAGILQDRASSVASTGRAAIEAWIAQERRVRWVPPLAGLSCCLRLPELMNDVQLAEHLRERYDTQVVPGAFFEAPGFVRVSFGLDPEAMTEALGHLSAAIDDLS
jgi:aspartate/methionine/tyrosine aminotransferase